MNAVGSEVAAPAPAAGVHLTEAFGWHRWRGDGAEAWAKGFVVDGRRALEGASR